MLLVHLHRMIDLISLSHYNAPAESAPKEGFVCPIIKPGRAALSNHQPTQDELVQRARFLLLCRRGRTTFFDPAMFDEVAWDALLNLYLDEQSGLAVSAVTLAGQVGVCLHVLIRWIGYLEGQGLVVRRRDELQAREGSVRLSDKGRFDLERYLSGTLATGWQ